jgi:transcriptional regulator with XRE-family HTH domain
MKSAQSYAIERFRKSLGIGDRLRHVREMLDFSQEQFGQPVIVTRERMANFETGRTPLPAIKALQICETFIISEKWLATGEGVTRQYIDLLHDPVANALPAEMDFAEAFGKFLGPRYEVLLAENPHTIRFTPSGDSPRFDANLIDCFLTIWRAWLPCGPTNARLIQSIIDLGNDYCANPNNLKGLMSERETLDILAEAGLPIGDGRFLTAHRRVANDEKKLLTEVAASGKLTPMESQLGNLLADLNRLTKESGKKTELAEFLSAPRTSVSRWLSGEREPGGKTTLRLLHWVEQQERKSKTLDSTTNTAKGKVTRRKLVYEKKPSSSRKTE